jgi:hypothetical protein
MALDRLPPDSTEMVARPPRVLASVQPSDGRDRRRCRRHRSTLERRLEPADWPGTLEFMLALGILFPAIEEIGLRGYYLDRLQERF